MHIAKLFALSVAGAALIVGAVACGGAKPASTPTPVSQQKAAPAGCNDQAAQAVKQSHNPKALAQAIASSVSACVGTSTSSSASASQTGSGSTSVSNRCTTISVNGKTSTTCDKP